ncbi:hypothetical protein [Acaricomes phytoseiuli]|uniref:hypothetical protein n=1 Tax=Acaricomes phytoseiuli TaxID=291968 RepID=UPI001FE0662D|nr:hypothetical protein [Acaricomes phytoseiuli]
MAGMRHWLIHTVIFLLAQVVFASAGYSWPWQVLTGQAEVSTILRTVDGAAWSSNASRIWAIVWVIDTVISVGSLAMARQRSNTGGAAS